MRLTISGHHLTVTDPLRDYVRTKFSKLERHYEQITSIVVSLTVDKLVQKAEATVYVLALIGLALFYGVERAIVASRGGRGQREKPDRRTFWLHIGASALLVAIIAYLLNNREDTSWIGLALFFGAMMLHFVTADFGARSDHAQIYDTRGRWVLAAATMAGWAAGLLLDLPELAIGGLFAFVGGGIILLVMKEELPKERRSRFLPFALGAALYALLVVGELIVRQSS